MLEYLNVIATVLLLFITVLTLGSKWSDLNWIWEGIESLNHVFEFLGKLPCWLDFYNNLYANEKLLQDKIKELLVRRDDISIRVEQEEFSTGRSMTHEVHNWLRNVKAIDEEVQAIHERLIQEHNQVSRFLYRAYLGSHVERKISDINYLYAHSTFEQGLLSAAIEAIQLATKPLVGITANAKVSNIMTSILEPGVTKVGVHGIQGIGKTAIMAHIHDRVLVDSNFQVHMIIVPKEFTEYMLQSRIAEAIGLDLPEEDGMIRAAWLKRALQRNNFVLILDGLTTHFSVENVGIPLHRTRGKMVITSRSQDVCRRMVCRPVFSIEPLQIDDALQLFMQFLELDTPVEPQLENVARNIVENCDFVPSRIRDAATDLRGQNDINEWEMYAMQM